MLKVLHIITLALWECAVMKGTSLSKAKPVTHITPEWRETQVSILSRLASCPDMLSDETLGSVRDLGEKLMRKSYLVNSRHLYYII